MWICAHACVNVARPSPMQRLGLFRTWHSEWQPNISPLAIAIDKAQPGPAAESGHQVEREAQRLWSRGASWAGLLLAATCCDPEPKWYRQSCRLLLAPKLWQMRKTFFRLLSRQRSRKRRGVWLALIGNSKFFPLWLLYIVPATNHNLQDLQPPMTGFCQRSPNSQTRKWGWPTVRWPGRVPSGTGEWIGKGWTVAALGKASHLFHDVPWLKVERHTIFGYLGMGARRGGSVHAL